MDHALTLALSHLQPEYKIHQNFAIILALIKLISIGMARVLLLVTSHSHQELPTTSFIVILPVIVAQANICIGMELALLHVHLHLPSLAIFALHPAKLANISTGMALAAQLVTLPF